MTNSKNNKLGKIKQKKIEQLKIELGYSERLARIRTEYFCQRSVHLGDDSPFTNKTFYSKWFTLLRWLSVILAVLTVGISLVLIIVIITNLCYETIMTTIFALLFSLELICLVITAVVRKFENSKVAGANLESILHYNDVDNIDELNEYINEMENIIQRPQKKIEWLNISVSLNILISLLGLYFTITNNSEIKDTFASLLFLILCSLWFLLVFQVVLGKNVDRLFSNEKIKSNILLSEFYNIKHKWKRRR